MSCIHSIDQGYKLSDNSFSATVSNQDQIPAEVLELHLARKGWIILNHFHSYHVG